METDISTHGYSSSWEWTRKHSNYHFDWQRKDKIGEWVTPLGTIVGNWSQDLDQMLESAGKPITWATRKQSPYYLKADGTYEQSKMIDQEENDLNQQGFGTQLELTDVIEREDFAPVFTRMYQLFGLEDPWVRLHLQRPGQMFNLHIDKLYDRNPTDPSQVCRIVVHLADWEPGQFYTYGTYTMSHWCAGEVHTFDWPNVPHATANASHHIRPTMIMTGIKTEQTKELLKQANKLSVYKI